MPSGADLIETENFSPTRALIVGDTKAGKTDYILRAAEAGYTVIYIDGDIGTQCLQSMVRAGRLSEAALNRIFILRAQDFLDKNGVYVPFMAEFFVKFCTSGNFLWDDTIQRPISATEYKPEDGHVIWRIRPAMLTQDVLVAVDSWTTLSTSVLHWKADDLKIDLLDIEKAERTIYSGVGHKLTQFLTLMSKLPCHLAVIGHPQEYIKKKMPKGKIGSIQEKDMEIEWSKMIPKSSSNPHGLTLGKSFSDIGWIDIDAMGRRIVDYRPADNRVIGGHLNAQGNVDELTLAKVIAQSGGKPPAETNTDSWLTRYGPGEFELPSAKTLTPGGGVAKGLGALASLKPSGVEKA